MILRLYATATSLAAPVLRHMLRQRAARGKEILLRLPEREGYASLPRPPGKLIWVHAASVGETMSALPLLELLPGPVLLTTGTVTSAQLAAERLPKGVLHQFVPLDVPGWVARFLAHWRPDAAVFFESEIWPNLLTALDARHTPRLLINARMSSRSALNWSRLPETASRLLGGFRVVMAQSSADADNFRALGAEVLEWGNLKFFTAPLPCVEADLAALRAHLPGPAWLAASTHTGEEEIIAAAHAALLADFPGLVTIIAPRHPERGAEVAALCGNAPRRSLGQPPVPGQLYIADTLGELGLFYRFCAFAFIGKSLCGPGGHNVVEPALLARPVIAGPHLENFAEAAGRLEAANALVRVTGAASLAAAAKVWLAAPAAARAAGLRAKSAFAGAEELPRRLAGLIMAALP
jgi:3-deoxy-D-manno-octulosonic-acid transferase